MRVGSGGLGFDSRVGQSVIGFFRQEILGSSTKSGIVPGWTAIGSPPITLGLKNIVGEMWVLITPLPTLVSGIKA